MIIIIKTIFLLFLLFTSFLVLGEGNKPLFKEVTFKDNMDTKIVVYCETTRGNELHLKFVKCKNEFLAKCSFDTTASLEPCTDDQQEKYIECLENAEQSAGCTRLDKDVIEDPTKGRPYNNVATRCLINYYKDQYFVDYDKAWSQSYNDRSIYYPAQQEGRFVESRDAEHYLWSYSWLMGKGVKADDNALKVIEDKIIRSRAIMDITTIGYEFFKTGKWLKNRKSTSKPGRYEVAWGLCGSGEAQWDHIKNNPSFKNAPKMEDNCPVKSASDCCQLLRETGYYYATDSCK